MLHNNAVPTAYLASHYPAVSHSFLWREVQALREQGAEVETMSIWRTPAGQLLTDADREAEATTFAILPPRPTALAGAHLRALGRGARRYFSTLMRGVRLGGPGVRGRLGGLFHFVEAIALWDHCRSAGIRHIHAQFADSATDAALLAAHYGGAAWSWSLAVHGPVEFYNVERYALAEKVRGASFVQAISHFGRSQLLTLVDEEHWHKVHVVHLGLDPAQFTRRAAPRTSAHQLRIVCVGRLVHLKGQSLIVEALAQLRDRGIEAHAVLVGDGPKREGLDELAEQLGVADRLELLGSVGQDRIQSVYESADVFCLPSFAEGIPVVLMEAMALELPVVTTRIMGIPELVEDRVSGLLVAPGDLDALVDALAELAADPQKRSAMGREGRRKVQADFDLHRSAVDLARLLPI